MREVAFVPTRKYERRSTLRRKKISSPEVLDIAASSERVTSGQDPESHDEEAVRLAINKTHLAFSQAHPFSLSCRAGPSPSKNA
jgi:hypothetical protein